MILLLLSPPERPLVPVATKLWYTSCSCQRASETSRQYYVPPSENRKTAPQTTCFRGGCWNMRARREPPRQTTAGGAEVGGGSRAPGTQLGARLRVPRHTRVSPRRKSTFGLARMKDDEACRAHAAASRPGLIRDEWISRVIAQPDSEELGHIWGTLAHKSNCAEVHAIWGQILRADVLTGAVFLGPFLLFGMEPLVGRSLRPRRSVDRKAGFPVALGPSSGGRRFRHRAAGEAPQLPLTSSGNQPGFGVSPLARSLPVRPTCPWPSFSLWAREPRTTQPAWVGGRRSSYRLQSRRRGPGPGPPRH
jgi:hypothetical protein